MTEHGFMTLAFNPLYIAKTPENEQKQQNNKTFFKQNTGFKSTLQNKFISMNEFQQICSKQNSYNL